MVSKLVRVSLAAGLFALGSGMGVAAEPLVTQGIGTSNCARLAGDLKPGEGLGNPVNLMLYSWVQGYVSAANVSLLEGDSQHVDMRDLGENKVVDMVMTYCRTNPDKKPVNAIDEFLRNSNKIKTRWETGTISWAE